MTLKLKAVFQDRIGIVADLSQLIAENGLNITSMEVERQDQRAFVFFEASGHEHIMGKESIFNVLGKIPDLIEISFIDILPQKIREKRFRVVLDNISDGVVSIGMDSNITTINKVACDILSCSPLEVIGNPIDILPLPDHKIKQCLSGISFTNIKLDLVTPSGRRHYFSTGRPIKDSSGNTIGAVEIIRDIKEIKAMAQSITKPDKFSFSDIVGQHPAITQAIDFAIKIAESDATICIRGDSGTGKELFARAIHTQSGRKGPFVPVNCAALPEQLLESELFGYIGGAFTGGKKEGKPGLFEIARQGTVFLDEISEMPLTAQAKVLRVIQDKYVRRIGGSKEIAIDTRIITATNRNIEQMVKEKSFRQDLYYRINVLPIHIPPLSARIEDIPLLVDHFLFQQNARFTNRHLSISAKALDKLSSHKWPGNVRELKNVIERAAVICDEDLIGPEHIHFSFEERQHGSAYIHRQADNIYSVEVPEHGNIKDLLADFEKFILKEVLRSSKSLRQTAKALEISHTALLNKIKRYNLKMET